MNYSIVLALFIMFVGLAYHVLFILTPSDLIDKRIPAIVAVISWFVLGLVSGGLIPALYQAWGNYELATIAGISFVLGGATLGHIVLGLARSRSQNDISYIAGRIYQEHESGETREKRES